MKKTWLLALLCAALAFTLAACGGGGAKAKNYAPGTYTGQSSENEDGDYAIATVTIGEDNKITDIEFVSYEKNGNIKDENYGKQDGEIANQDYFNRAQNAVAAMQKYADQVLEVQDLAKLDAITGATLSYDQFNESVSIALSKAEQ